MKLRISHRTAYSYDYPDAYALQRLRLTPMTGENQDVFDWTVQVEGAEEQVRYTDAFGNLTQLVSVSSGATELVVYASGRVETLDKAGVTGPHRGYAPLWLFLQETPLSAPGDAIRELAESIEPGSRLSQLHGLLGSIVERVSYEPGSTQVTTTAEEAAQAGKGVCQDQAHIFISTARLLGIPARYVSGYLALDKGGDAASHAWAEAHIDDLGWVAFDPANGISPDERYVRLAIGRDYHDASPISGLRMGESPERLAVRVTVEQ